jgi:hypothetical protein
MSTLNYRSISSKVGELKLLSFFIYVFHYLKSIEIAI